MLSFVECCCCSATAFLIMLISPSLPPNTVSESAVAGRRSLLLSLVRVLRVGSMGSNVWFSLNFNSSLRESVDSATHTYCSAMTNANPSICESVKWLFEYVLVLAQQHPCLMDDHDEEDVSC